MSDEMETVGWMKPTSVEMTFTDADPEVMALLMGAESVHDMKQTIHSVEMWIPIKRTFWQWLLRRPIQRRVIFIPNAKVDMNWEDPK